MNRPEHVEQVQKLFVRHAAVLQGFIVAFVTGLAMAEDVFQELFITVTDQSPKFKLGTDFLAWARAIAKIKIMEHFRLSKAGPRAMKEDVMDALAASAQDAPDSWEDRRETLARCMDQLAPKAREVIELRYCEDLLAPPAIARKLSWTVESVNVALARARKFLRECAERKAAMA